MPVQRPDNQPLRGLDRPIPLFSDRHHAGEELYFGRLPDTLEDAIGVALTPGGVEVAYPYTYLLGASLHLLPAEGFAEPEPVADTRPAPRRRTVSPYVVHGVAGRDVVLFDDGLGSLAALTSAAGALRAGQPRRLLLAVPAMTPIVARLFQPRLVERVVTARRFPKGPITPALYARPEPPPAAFAEKLILGMTGEEGRRNAQLRVSLRTEGAGTPLVRPAPRLPGVRASGLPVVPASGLPIGAPWFLASQRIDGSGLDN